MTLDEYQRAANFTAVYANQFRIVYPALGLASEAGEVAGKIKKVLRDQGGDFESAPVESIRDELGDVLWYVAVLATDLGISLEELAELNLEKLKSRLDRTRITGSGDAR